MSLKKRSRSALLFSPLLHARQHIPFTIKILDVQARALRLTDESARTMLQMGLNDQFAPATLGLIELVSWNRIGETVRLFGSVRLSRCGHVREVPTGDPTSRGDKEAGRLAVRSGICPSWWSGCRAADLSRPGPGHNLHSSHVLE